MRRSIIAAALLATGIVTSIAGPAQAYSPYAQGYGGQGYGYASQGYGQPDWQQRRAWREQRDEARIAEAARMEAMRIQQEREMRHQWRREQFGNGYRNW